MNTLTELKEKHHLNKLTIEDTDLIRTIELVEDFNTITEITLIYGKLRKLCSEIEIKNYMIDTLIKHIKKGVK